MKLSKRLSALCDMVPQGSAVIDVGCDHAYVPVHLLACGISPCAIASDIRPGPLAAAKAHIREAGVSDRIAVCLSDGVPLKAVSILTSVGYRRDAAPVTLITAGMGGMMMLDILQRALHSEEPEFSKGWFRYYLASPQKDAEAFRHGLTKAGYRIIRERLVEEDGKYYPVILSEYDPMPPEKLTKDEAMLGPCLIRERGTVFLNYLAGREAVVEKILASLPADKPERTEAVKEELTMIRRYLEPRSGN